VVAAQGQAAVSGAVGALGSAGRRRSMHAVVGVMVCCSGVSVQRVVVACAWCSQCMGAGLRRALRRGNRDSYCGGQVSSGEPGCSRPWVSLVIATGGCLLPCRIAAAKARQEQPELQQQWSDAGARSLEQAKRLGQQSSEIGADRPIAGCAFSPDGQLLATCCEWHDLPVQPGPLVLLVLAQMLTCHESMSLVSPSPRLSSC
jgi:hypothetical protein